MNNFISQLLRHKSVASLVLALAFGTLSASAGPARQIAPPQSHDFGRSYSQWAAAWWQWAFSLPVAGHPALDPNADISIGQSGHVWFLGAPFGTLERNITVPTGTALYVPIINVDSSTLEEPPFFGATAAEQLAIASGFADFITDVSFSLDGRTLGNIADFRVASPQFTFTAPSPWIFGDTGGTGQATGVGYFVLIEPLSAGIHTIHYTGAFKFSDAPEDYIGSDVTFHVTVK